VRARKVTRWLLGLLTIAACFAATASTASAHNPSVTEFQAGLSPNNGAWDLVEGDEGRLWFTRRRSVAPRAGHSYLAPRGPHLARRRN
jgi:hypothetical protein